MKHVSANRPERGILRASRQYLMKPSRSLAPVCFVRKHGSLSCRINARRKRLRRRSKVRSQQSAPPPSFGLIPTPRSISTDTQPRCSTDDEPGRIEEDKRAEKGRLVPGRRAVGERQCGHGVASCAGKYKRP